MKSDRVILCDFLAAVVSADFHQGKIPPSLLAAAGPAALRLALDRLDSNGPTNHPLGFCRVPITDWQLDAPRAAVHIWDGSAGLRISDDIHDHCYDFVSLCLAGGM